MMFEGLKVGFKKIAGFSNEKEMPSSVDKVSGVIKNSFFERVAEDGTYKTSKEKQYAFERLSPHHRKYFGLEHMDETKLMSIANDVVAIYNERNEIESFIILEELSESSDLKSEENNYNFYKKYKEVKRIPYSEIFNEPDLFLRKSKSREKMMNILEKIMKDPSSYHKFRKEMISPMDPRDASFKSLFYMINLMVELDEDKFKEIAKFYKNLNSREQHFSFLESFVVLSKNPDSIDLLMNAVKNPSFIDENNRENKLIKKFRGILNLIDKRNSLIEEMMTEKGKNGVDPWEFNEAILKRLNLLLYKAGQLNSREKADELLNDSVDFKEELLLMGAISRGLSPDKFIGAMKDVNVEIGVRILRDDDLSVIEEMIRNNSKKYPEKGESLVKKLAKEAVDKNVKWFVIRWKDKIVGCRKNLKISDNEYVLGTFYVLPEFQNSFRIGNKLEKWTIDDIPDGAKVLTIVPSIKSLMRHVEAGNRIIVGIDENDQRKPFIAQTKINDSDFKARDFQNYPKKKILSLAKTNIKNNSIEFFSFTNIKEFKSYVVEMEKKGFAVVRLIEENDKFYGATEKIK